MRVLVVEDEPKMAHHLAGALLEESYAVDLAHDGERALELALANDYDVIVLDLMLPKLDGLTVCRRLRQRGRHTPVLILSARDLLEDRVGGLDAGADDYLIKPFAIEELVARIRALQRRHAQSTLPILRVGDLELDRDTRSARRNGQGISLTAKEYALLEYLMRRPGVVHTRSMIAEHVWGAPLDHQSNVVDVYVKHLRDKINGLDLKHAPGFIQSVRGMGYVVRDPGAPDTD